MFKIYTDNILMYDDESTSESLKVVNPKLSLAQSSAGTLTMTVPPGNSGYNHLDRLTSVIRVYKNTQQDPYWEGRILSETTDFWKCKTVTCEGVLAVLNDTIQEPAHYQNSTLRAFLTSLLTNHNENVDDWKKIYVGTTEAELSSNHRYTNYESTLECINDKLLDKEGGYIQLRYENGLRYLDYLINYPSENSQKIEFGKNLLDFSKSFSSEDFITVLVPRGAELDEGPIPALTPYVTVETVNNNSIYVTLTNDDFEEPPETLPIDEFGWIVGVHDWSDVSYPSNLLRKAKEYLKSIQFDNMQLEVSALDLRYSGAQYEEINLNDTVRVVSNPHGLDRLFPVTKLDIPLDQPQNTKFTLGTSVKVSLTHRDKQNIVAIKNEIAALPTEQRIIDKAKSEAASIVDSAITGYITIVHNPETGAEEFIVSSLPDYMDDNATYWRWTHGGLAFYPQGHNTDPSDVTIAITNTGQISADLITVGKLVADIIQLGVLQDQPDGVTPGGNFYLNLETGELRIGQLTTVINQINNIGGTNLMANTLGWVNTYSVDLVPKIFGQPWHTYVNGYTVSPANHGVRLTKDTSQNYLLIGFGESSTSSAYGSLNGLVPGNTYTFSFNLKARVLSVSGAPSSIWRLVLGTRNSNNDLVTQELWTHSVNNGVEETFRVVTTFTIPNDAITLAIQLSTRVADETSVRPDESYYDATDYYELTDIKLEEGLVPTKWSPAPQDLEKEIEDGDNAMFEMLDGSMKSYIQKTDSSIDSVVSKVEILNGDVSTEGSIAKILYTSEQQTAENYTKAIGSAVSYANGFVSKAETRFEFSQDGLEIKGTSGSSSGSSLKLASDKVSLLENGSERLWLNANGANAEVFNANNFIKIGNDNTEKYIWEAYSNGFRLRKA